MADNWKGISFPFRFGNRGGVNTSTTDTERLDHVRESIKQILLTSAIENERVMRYGWGSRLSTMVFEPENEATKALIIQQIWSTLMTYEPRIIPTSVDVWYDEEKLFCKVNFMLKKFMTQGTTTVVIGGS